MGVGQAPRCVQRPSLTPRLVHMGFFRDIVALWGRVYLWALLFSYASYCSTSAPLLMSSGVGKIGPNDATVSLAQRISWRASFVRTGLIVPEISFWENVLFLLYWMYCHIVLSLVFEPIFMISSDEGNSYWATGQSRSKRLPVSMSAVVGVEQPYFESVRPHPHSSAVNVWSYTVTPPCALLLYLYLYLSERNIYSIWKFKDTVSI